ncbi:MAG: phosphate ABC transporter permease PstA [candidate division KSB1 bacterium]|nr:phosphate ABC transporter permease PstA [candidate division KSB1 bacterium]MDZ7368120.1 phosphate ABC transporter permease PstA [candidate division KSB1 bacterium]MDZ7405799.1 phosphate ABC transporter permease PstA [candidate division KSB1 bacterium]
MKSFWKSGNAFIWLTGMAAGIGLLMIGGLIALILTNGLGIFWPARLEELTLKDGSKVLGEIWNRERIPGAGADAPAARIRLKIGNRDFYGLDFRWINEAEIEARRFPDSVFVFERQAWGNFFGYATELALADETIARGAGQIAAALPKLLQETGRLLQQITHIEKKVIGDINHEIEKRRLAIRRLSLRQNVDAGPASQKQKFEAEISALQKQYDQNEKQLESLREKGEAYQLTIQTVDGRAKTITLLEIVRAFQPNQMSGLDKAGLYLARMWEFLTSEPREANMEGGVAPAIFGTVLMVFIMSVAVVPLGVLTAIYMREYAKQGPFVRTLRIAVNNLAGVPSIVFGIFGLGFFVYAIGGTIDKFFYPEALPTPTYGTGGIFWAALTLALLTVPVVIVTTEEGLAAVPTAMREASLGLGATKFETLWRVLIPSASPAILTGLILAMARAAGEVAPLMITGVVKLAPSLPLDGHFPYLHLERKFMHLGFHIYDVGFQSPNVEASLPMVYATTLLLILIVLVLNLTAIFLRNRLRRRFAMGQF